MFKTITTNWRDIVAFLIIGIGITILSGLIDYASTRFGDSTFLRLILPPLVNFLKGFSKFYAAAVSATTLWMLLWPTVNHWANHSFAEVWEQWLTPQHRFLTYIVLVGFALIAAALCFSGQ